MFHAPHRHNNMQKEHCRDIRFIITGHALISITIIALCMLFLFFAQEYLWGTGYKPQTIFQEMWNWLSVVWIAGLLPTMIGTAGLLSFMHPYKLDEVPHIDIPVCWRIVSKGTNLETLKQTIERIQYEMTRTPLFPYIIEVVVDKPIVWEYQWSDVIFLHVPKEYETPNNTRFKSRAMHYALYHSTIPDWTWIVHLDEETQPTSSGIKGIAQMIIEENDKEKPAVGQGAILYHRNWKRNRFLFMADMVRTGDDFSRFYFQSSTGITIFGMHGSYIVARNDMEKATGGFDFGPDGDITEDATWALTIMDQGYRTRWVEGYLEEQPCQSITDLFRQRKRWWSGLWDTWRKTKVSWKWRAILGYGIVAWAIAPFAMIYTIGHLFYGTEISTVVTLFANFIYASYFSLYIVGLLANLKEGLKEESIWTKLFLIITQTILTMLAVFSFLEAVGILWSIVDRDKGFHVIKK